MFFRLLYFRLLMFVLFVMSGCLTCFSLIQNDSEESVRITGKVVDKETGKPIAGATIRIKDKSFALISSETGFFTLCVKAPEVLYVSFPNKDTELVRVIRSQKNYQVELENKVEIIYRIVPQMPEFPGGDEAYLKFFSDRLKYQLEGSKEIVYIEAVVEKDGSMSDVKIRHGDSPVLVEEALRVFRMMPKWRPGIRRGEPVRVRKLFAVEFSGTMGLGEFVDFWENEEGECEPFDEYGVYSVAAEMPKYPKGMDACMEFIALHFNWPKDLDETEIKGRIVVQFVVEKDGTITSPTLLRGLHPLLDEEALRVIRLMPDWIPGRNDGTPVPVKYTLPIIFDDK